MKLYGLLFQLSQEKDPALHVHVFDFVKSEGIKDREIPKQLGLAITKIKSSQLLDPSFMADVQADLKSIDNDPFHDVMIMILRTVSGKFCEQSRDEIQHAEDTIKNALFHGLVLPQMGISPTYIILLNYHRLSSLNYKDLIRASDSELELQTRVALALNTFLFLGKIPKELFTKSDTNYMMRKADSLLNDQNTGKEFLCFSSKMRKGCPIFLATDGEALAYVDTNPYASLPCTAHNYKGYSEIHSNLFTNDKINTYSQEGQEVWNSFTQHVIKLASNLIKNDPNYRNLKNLLTFFGEKRQHIAQRLDHHPEYGDTFQFGVLRTSGSAAVEVSETGFSSWRKLYPDLLTRVQEKEKEFQDLYGRFASNLKTQQMHNFFNIVLSESYSQRGTIIYFNFPYIENKEELDEELQKIQHEFDKLFSWDGNDSNELIKDLGKLCYSLYRLLPFELGTSGVVIWLMHSIATHHQLTLVPKQGEKNVLPPDFEAFLTFSQEDYALWFLEHAFQEVVSCSSEKKAFEEKEEKADDSRITITVVGQNRNSFLSPIPKVNTSVVGKQEPTIVDDDQEEQSPTGWKKLGIFLFYATILPFLFYWGWQAVKAIGRYFKTEDPSNSSASFSNIRT